MKCQFCNRMFNHYHTEMVAPNGNIVEAVVTIPDDPNAEVRDPDTGEVIFPAVKRPFKLIQGGVTSALPSQEGNKP